MKQPGYLLLAMITLFCYAPALRAAVIEDFLFDAPAGTLLENTVNNAGTGHMWDADQDADDFAGVATNGSGQLNASIKDNDDFATTYVDLDPDISSGSLYGVIELTYDFDPNTLNTAENEEIRLSLIQFDPRSTFVTAEVEIERTDNNDVVIFGNGVGTGSVDTPEDTLGLTQSDKMIAVIAAGLDNDRMEVHYSLDAGASFTTISGGMLDPSRGVASMRLVLNNDLSDDNVLLDRVYLTDMNPFPGQIPSIPEPASMLLMASGMLALVLRRQK